MKSEPQWLQKPEISRGKNAHDQKHGPTNEHKDAM
jgi:hypothetical protein